MTLARTHPPLADIARALISSALETAEHERARTNVLVDLEVDGFHCSVIRSAQVSHQKPPLSPRKLQIADMIAAGNTNKAIAASLGISSATVSTHIRRAFSKLNTRSRAEMVARLAAPERALPSLSGREESRSG